MLELHTLSQKVMAMLHMGMLILTMPYLFSTRLLLPGPCSSCILGGLGGG
jgi:hypothetical protein